MRVRSRSELFSGLYDEYMPKVYAYVRYKVKTVETAEDLTSVVFDKALSSFNKYSSDKSGFSTWIFTIARNVLIDHYRSESRRRHVDLDETIGTPSSQPSPEEEAERQSEKECLLGCLSRLGEQDRELVQLKFGAEMTNRQISKVLNLSESNVGVRLFRAIKKLRQSFEASWNG